MTRTAVITGGLSGLGAATVARLQTDGIRTIVFDRSPGADFGLDISDSAAVDVNGTFNLCRAFIPGMRDKGWGRIVNFASMAGKDGNPKMSAYSSTKAAVIALTKSLCKELANDGVLVNAIAPAVIDTPMNANTSPDVLKHITSLIPMKRVGRPDEVAELVAWLASDRVSFSTGAIYDISGGRATY